MERPDDHQSLLSSDKGTLQAAGAAEQHSQSDSRLGPSSASGLGPSYNGSLSFRPFKVIMQSSMDALR
eukprot:6704636-Karenia_brevis.AAC.1